MVASNELGTALIRPVAAFSRGISKLSESNLTPPGREKRSHGGLDRGRLERHDGSIRLAAKAGFRHISQLREGN